MILLWDALGLGMRALTLSANTQTGEDEKLEGAPLYLTLGLSLTFGIGLFFLFPAGIGGLAEHYLGWRSWLNNLTEGVVPILVFTALGPMPMLWRLATRILFIPLLAGVAVEYIRWTANHLNNPIVQLMIKPNLALQHLTTRTPDLSMLEVAIESF